MKSDQPPSASAMDTAIQLHRSALKLLRMLRLTQPAAGLSMAKLGVLGHLHQGVTTAGELAAYLRIQPQSLTRLIADLERTGLISRRPNASDRRQTLLEITETGVRMLSAEIQDQRARLARTIAEALTPAEEQLLRISAGLMDRVAALTEARDGCPLPTNAKKR